ncbi:MAG: RluA family pseudouridine synthase [Oscillospiraceae bacterium]|nr:RluA family pseudouridine synthase [Oscillospiraceae bacterium]
MDRVLEYIVDVQYDGANVLTVLRQHFKISTNLIKDLKKYEDGIRLNGAHIRTVDTVRMGDTLKVTIRDSASENIIPKNIPIDIVYEDEDILIINKPPHMPTHPSMGNYENSLANGVMHYYKSKGENRVFRAVNRLDKDTSGLMAVAKNSYAHARLSEELHTADFKRKYKCIVCGDMTEDGTVDAPIKRADGSVINRIVAPDGQRAVTHYSVLERYGEYTLLELELETGRTHQIRVHMSHIGHPLVGDWLYGIEDHSIAPRQFLHSCYLSLIHPVTEEKLVFQNEIAQDMKDFIEKLF